MYIVIRPFQNKTAVAARLQLDDFPEKSKIKKKCVVLYGMGETDGKFPRKALFLQKMLPTRKLLI